MSQDKENGQTSSEEEILLHGSLGKLLISYRDKANLDVPQVAQALRLPPASIKSLEDEDFSKLPEPPYVRGYLRSYAGLAGEDPQQAIDLYEAIRENSDEYPVYNASITPNKVDSLPPNELISPFRFKMGLLTLGLLSLILLSMIPSVQQGMRNVWAKFTPPAPENKTIDIGTTISDQIEGNLPEPTTQDNQEADNTESTQTDETTTEVGNDEEVAQDNENQDPAPVEESAENTESTETPTPSETTSEPDATATSENETDTQGDETTPDVAETVSEDESTEENNDNQNNPNNKNIKFVFSEEVWVRINDPQGKRLFEALNPAGTEKEISLEGSLKFIIGNAQAAKVFINGQEKSITEYINGSVAKFDLD